MQEKVKFDQSKLLIDIDSSWKKMERKIKIRDFTESIVALLLIPYFAYIAYGLDNILTQIGCVIIILSCMLIIYKLKAVKKHKKMDVTTSLKEQFVQLHHYISQEKALLDNILTWYILPPSIGLTFFFVGTAGLSLKLAGSLLFCGIVMGIVYWINQKTAKTYYEPILKQLEGVISEIS